MFFMCSEPETIVHLFTKCPVAFPLWPFVLNLTNYITGVELMLKSSTVLFNVMEHNYSKNVKAVYLYLINRAKHFIWLQRHSSKFEGMLVTANSIKYCFIRDVNFRMLLDRARFSDETYSAYWGDTYCISE